MYNDTPVIEEGDWKLLAPTKYATKYRHLSEAPIVVHCCQECECCNGEIVIDNTVMIDAPRCTICKQEIPSGIQAVWQLTHDKEMLR